MIRQLISACMYIKPVQFSASVDAWKRLKPAYTEDGYKPFCSVDRPLDSSDGFSRSALKRSLHHYTTSYQFSWDLCFYNWL